MMIIGNLNEKLAKYLLEKNLKKKFGEELTLEVRKCDVRLENDGRVSLNFDGNVSLPVETLAMLLTKEKEK